MAEQSTTVSTEKPNKAKVLAGMEAMLSPATSTSLRTSTPQVPEPAPMAALVAPDSVKPDEIAPVLEAADQKNNTNKNKNKKNKEKRDGALLQSPAAPHGLALLGCHLQSDGNYVLI